MAINQRTLDALNDSIVDLDEVNVKLKLLLYGVSGVGKTVEALDLAQRLNPTGQQILYVDTGEGWVSLKNHRHLMPNVKRMLYMGLSQFESLVDAIRESVPGFDNYSTIVFDEFSTVGKKDIHTVMNATLDKNDPFATPEFKQYNIATRRMERTAFKLLELKETHHLIFVSHSRTDKDDITKIITHSPSFMAKFSETLKESMHVVARQTADIQNKEGTPIYKREIQVHPSKMVVAKSRIGGLDIKVPPERFNEVISQWVVDDGNLVDEKEVVELVSEKKVTGDFSDQTQFSGYEVEGE